jgi:hypothetical protein
LEACGAFKAQTPSVEFGGERYIKKKEASPSADESYVQFGLEGESLAGWTKLVTFHSLPHTDREPVAAASAMGKFIKKHA